MEGALWDLERRFRDGRVSHRQLYRRAAALVGGGAFVEWAAIRAVRRARLDDSKANRLEPRKRPRTTLTPSLALKDGAPFLAFGTSGGDEQDQVNIQFFLNVVEFGMDLQEAIDAPNFQIAHFPSSFFPAKPPPAKSASRDASTPRRWKTWPAVGTL